MKCFATLWSIVRFPTASIQLLWLVRQNPVKSVVHMFVTSKGPAAPSDALRGAGNARSSRGLPSYPQSVGLPVSITFVIPAARISSVSMTAGNYVQSGTSATIVPPNADRVVFITVANAVAQRRVRHAPSHVHGHALMSHVRFHVARYVSHTELVPLTGC